MNVTQGRSQRVTKKTWVGEGGEEKDQDQGLPSRYKHRVPHATTDIYE